ncbi:MAG: putative dsRNA-binding protein [bacterium]|nr:putative dsRNA-binding protein [bacterium]
MLLEDAHQTFPYQFKSKDLLQEALTIPATNGNYNYQRLEFLGDAVLQLLISETLYIAYPRADEGTLTLMRKLLVSGDAIYQRSARLYPQWNQLIASLNTNFQGNKKATIDIIEALIGAAWLDGGRAAAETFVSALILPEDIQALHILENAPLTNPKGALQEFAQKRFQVDPRYECRKQEGPKHKPTFTCAAIVLDKEAIATGASLKEAEANAALQLLQQLRQQDLF